jgi:Fe-S cluster biosynthesis and repair protein YggX
MTSEQAEAGIEVKEITACSRCGEKASRLDAAPLPGDLGIEIQTRVCARCWTEWEAEEVRVINEHRLNFMDPEAQQVLRRHLRAYLCLDRPETSDRA